LIYGGRLVVVPRLTTRSPEEFHQLLCGEMVTILNQTPGAFRQLMAAQVASRQAHQLRRVIFGGEALEVATLKSWYQDRRNQRTRLINMYGITETTVHVTYRRLEPPDSERPGNSPIGRRIPDLKVYLLDNHGQPVPIGVSAEMYVGGAGVARGYLNRPELTAERFVADPLAGHPGARMYKTGDMARFLLNGEMEFLGRNDSQVKVRGFRIELGEIEARLLHYPAIREAVVVARESDQGDKRLVAYYTALPAADIETTVSAEVLHAHLSATLPEHMVPSAYVMLEALPLTTNGKLDRRALPSPGGEAYATRKYQAPVGEIETTLARIWAELLQLERVGRHDHFFALGGHSLLAVRLIERMRAEGLHTDVRTLFATPTLNEFAAATEDMEVSL
jgi:acyl-coenzyme A synthetase/AMP-(fatty) acid ligase/aryl carrier-like protein